MIVNWEDVIRRLQSYPPHVHAFLPPCSEDRIQAVTEEFGQVPEQLTAMLQHFNGAKLFCRSVPLVSLFGISTTPQLSPLEWAPEYLIDQYTRRWRSSPNRQGDWPIAMMNYGGLIVLSADQTLKEWDRSQGRWSQATWTFHDWIEELLREGDIYLRE